MINRTLTMIAVFMISTCMSASQASAKSDVAGEVKAALKSQVESWNACDLEKAMTSYWNSTEMLWISRAGVEKGYLAVLEGYRKDFADKSKMGVYSYEPLYIETLSKTSAYYVFRWKIELNGKKIMGGVSSQIWKKMKGRWVITSEHAG